jgi:hypothetical protein
LLTCGLMCPGRVLVGIEGQGREALAQRVGADLGKLGGTVWLGVV